MPLERFIARLTGQPTNEEVNASLDEMTELGAEAYDELMDNNGVDDLTRKRLLENLFNNTRKNKQLFIETVIDAADHTNLESWTPSTQTGLGLLGLAWQQFQRLLPGGGRKE
jgi:hypothetical protein